MSSFNPIAATLANGAIYLNVPSNYYTIDISPALLGDQYLPDPNDPYNEPGSWSITNIFAGPAPSSGLVPTTTFSLGQAPVTFYIQNVGATPIEVIFDTNIVPDTYTYFSFGVPPNETPSSYLMDPLSILIIQTVFTSNNIVRFYNSFLDSLNYDHLGRILDQAKKVGYYDATGNTIVGPVNESTLTLTSDYTLPLASQGLSYTQYNITISGATLTLDGTDIAGDSNYLIVVNVQNQSNLALVNLVGTTNYQGQGVPSTLLANRSYFIVVDNTRVVAYDPSTAGTISPTHIPGGLTGQLNLSLSSGDVSIDSYSNNNTTPSFTQQGNTLVSARDGYMTMPFSFPGQKVEVLVNGGSVGTLPLTAPTLTKEGDSVSFKYDGTDPSSASGYTVSSSFNPNRVVVPLS